MKKANNLPVRASAISTSSRASDGVIVLTAAGLTYTLDAAPSDGDTYVVVAAGGAQTVNGGGHNVVCGGTSAATLAVPSGAAVSLKYISASGLWYAIGASGAGSP